MLVLFKRVVFPFFFVVWFAWLLLLLLPSAVGAQGVPESVITEVKCRAVPPGTLKEHIESSALAPYWTGRDSDGDHWLQFRDGTEAFMVVLYLAKEKRYCIMGIGAKNQTIEEGEST